MFKIGDKVVVSEDAELENGKKLIDVYKEAEVSFPQYFYVAKPLESAFYRLITIRDKNWNTFFVDLKYILQWKFDGIKDSGNRREVDNYYWNNITAMQQKQTQKGVNKYGQRLEENKSLQFNEGLTYLQEELIDALMYCEHIKTVDYGANEYQTECLRTANGLDKKQLLLNGALGLCGEVGEVADIIKKHMFQEHDLSKQKLIEELGDVSWYLAIICFAFDVKLSDVFKYNIEKLNKRYPDGFDKNKSINREDK